MRMYPTQFPSGRRRKPKRRAEREVYAALAAIKRRGFVYYEWRRGYEYIELDFAVWIEGLGRFALQVKGGRYLIVDGQWYLKKRDGLRPIKSCPLDATKLAALDLHDDIEELAGTRYNPYVIPVLLFPDMGPDAAVENLGRRAGVYVIWGVRDLLADLEKIVRSRRVSEALGMDRIAGEVHAVTDGLICLEKFGKRCVVDAADQPVSVPEQQPYIGTLRLTLVGVDVTTTRASGVPPVG